MADLPTGTVTFLFTDIQGSTALGEQYPEAMRHALIRHDALVEQVVGEHSGEVPGCSGFVYTATPIGAMGRRK